MEWNEPKDKFIIYNHSPKDIDDLRLFELVCGVIKNGKISTNNTEYCLCTVFGGKDVVSARKTKTGYRFDIYDDTTFKVKESD